MSIQNLFALIQSLAAQRLTTLGMGKKAQRRAKGRMVQASPDDETLRVPFVQHTNPDRNTARKIKKIMGARQYRIMTKRANVARRAPRTMSLPV